MPVKRQINELSHYCF